MHFYVLKYEFLKYEKFQGCKAAFIFVLLTGMGLNRFDYTMIFELFNCLLIVCNFLLDNLLSVKKIYDLI